MHINLAPSSAIKSISSQREQFNLNSLVTNSTPNNSFHCQFTSNFHPICPQYNDTKNHEALSSLVYRRACTDIASRFLSLPRQGWH
jgi:hypothetical protein